MGGDRLHQIAGHRAGPAWHPRQRDPAGRGGRARIRAVIAAKAETLGKPVEEIAALYENQAAMGRMVTARDIANMVLFNASEAARSVSGQAIVVDGFTQKLY